MRKNTVSIVTVILLSVFIGNVNAQDVNIKKIVSAIYNGDIALTEEILNNGSVDANTIIDKKREKSVVALAMERGHFDIVKLLIKRGANPDSDFKRSSMKSHKCPLLIIAIEKGDIDIIKVLLDAGADVDAEDDSSRRKTAVMVAIANGHIDIAKLLIEKEAIIDNIEAFRLAVKSKQPDSVKLLLSMGVSPDTFMYHESLKREINTALIYATDKGYIDIVQTLLDGGANINKINKPPGRNFGLIQTPLSNALGGSFRKQKHYDIAKLLIESGADVNAGDKYFIKGKEFQHWTALMFAIHDKKFKIVKLLVEKGVDVNIRSDMTGNLMKKTTALIIAVKNQDTKIVKLLLKNGADPNISGKDGTPLQIAEKIKSIVITTLLKKAGATK